MASIVCLIAALLVPSMAVAAPQIVPRIDQTKGQVTVSWNSTLEGTSELRWDAQSRASFSSFPTSNDESNRVVKYAYTVKPLTFPHSRTISDLAAGDYWLAVRTTAANGAVEESAVIRIEVTPELGAGSMGQLKFDRQDGGPVTVTSTKTIDAKTFIAGNYDTIGQRTGSGVLVSNQDATRGDVIPGGPQITRIDPANPDAQATVYTSVRDTRGGWYIGGNFTHVGGYPMPGVAHLFADGGVDPNFAPGSGIGMTGSVRALDVDALNFSPPRLYVGGGFSEWNGERQNNIVAVNGATGKRDTSFETTAGRNTGTNAPVFAIKVDDRLSGTGPDKEKTDYSGVYIAGAFTYFRGMAMSRVAKLELSGNRSRYSKDIPIDDSMEWSVIQMVVGDHAFTQNGWFESCGYGTPKSATYKCALMDAGAFRPTPVDDLNQAYTKEQVFAKTVDVGPVVTTINDAAPMRAITSLDTYHQYRCVTGLPLAPKPGGFLVNIPIIGMFIALSNAASAAMNPNSPANLYMSDFMYKRVVESYDQTLIFGGRFENSDRTTTSTILSGFDAAAGTQDLTSSNPSMSTLEGFFPNLGQRLRADMTMVSSRLDASGIDGTINSIVVSDTNGCDNDNAYVGGDFSFQSSTAGVRGADLGRVRLDKVYNAKWKVDPTYLSVRTETTGTDGKAVGTISLDVPSAPTQITAAGTFAGVASNGTYTDRSGIVILDAATGAYKQQTMRDGADGAVLTVTDNGKHAFVGGTFTAYDSWKRAGLGAITTTGGAAARVSIDKDFATSDRIGGGKIAAMTKTANRLFIGGDFTSAGDKQRSGLVAYGLAADTNGQTDPVIGRAGGGPRGTVNELVSTADRVFVGGDFDGYVSRAADGSELAKCTCRNLVVLDAVTGMPFGMQPDGGGRYLYADVDTDGPVEALALDGTQTHLYVGGSFDHVGGSNEDFGGLLGVNVANGTVDTAFHATAGGTNGTVNVLVVSGGDLLVGGDFDEIRGAAASNLGKLDLATGKPDPKFNPAYRTESGTNGPITAMVVLGNVVVIAGDFSEYNGVDRTKIAAVDLVTGNIIGGFAPNVPGDISSISLVGDRIVIGGEGGTVSTGSVQSADVTKPTISANPADAVSGGVSIGGSTFVKGGEGASLTLSIRANDAFEFDDLYNGGSLGLQTITWPAIPGVADASETDITAAKRLQLRCTGTGVDGAAAEPLVADVNDIAWTATKRPAGLDRFVGAIDCTWTGILVIPTNKSADFALTTSDPAMKATTTGPLTPGDAVPITVTWNGMPSNADPKLFWNDTNAGFTNGVARTVPSAAFAPREPFTRTYSFPAAGAPDGVYADLAVKVVDQGQNEQSITLPRITVDATPPVASRVAMAAGSPRISTGALELAITPPAVGDGAGSGLKTRELQFQTAAFATTGDGQCVAPAANDPWTTLPGGAIDVAATSTQTVPVVGLTEGCHRFRLVSTDNVGWTQTDDLAIEGGWAFVDVAGPTADTTDVPGLIEGANVLLGGTLNDTGAGVDRFDVDVVGSERWDMCADTTTNGRWSCAFDTTGADDGAYDIAVTGTDRLDQAGNEQVVHGVHVDNVGPQVELAVAAGAGTGAQFLDAKRGVTPVLWFNPREGGSFRLDATSVDDGFGSVVAMPQLGIDAGWNLPVEDEAPARRAAGRKTSAAATGSAAESMTYTWAAGATAPGLVSVIGTETAGKSGAASLDVRADGDAPTGVAVELGADETITISQGTDAGSGIAAVELERRQAGIVEHSTCDATWSAWTTVPVTDIAAPIVDADVNDVTCYEYRVAATDRVGNKATSSATTTRFVGNPAAPAAPTPAASTPDPVTPDPTPEAAVEEPAKEEPAKVEPETTRPEAAEPAVTKPVELRETATPAVVEPVKTPAAAEPATRAPAETTAPAATTPKVEEPVSQTNDDSAQPAATGTDRVTTTTPKPKAKVERPEIATTEPAASTPEKPKATKKADKSWVKDTIGWVKKHPIGAVTLGLAGAQVGSSLLFGKGIGALLAKLHGMTGGHTNPPLRVVREIAKRGRNFWKGRRNGSGDDDLDLDDDEDDFDAIDSRRAA